MSRPGGRSVLAEIGRQLIDMLEDASRDVTQAPYARPEAPPREMPTRESPPPVELLPIEAGPDEETARAPSQRRERAPIAPPLRTDRSIRSQLRSKSAVRRALVLNEILGPPKAISDDFPR